MHAFVGVKACLLYTSKDVRFFLTGGRAACVFMAFSGLRPDGEEEASPKGSPVVTLSLIHILPEGTCFSPAK